MVASPQGDPPPGHFRTADLLGALSLAADIAIGLPDEHAVRSCYIAMHLADQLRPPAGAARRPLLRRNS